MVLIPVIIALLILLAIAIFAFISIILAGPTLGILIAILVTIATAIISTLFFLLTPPYITTVIGLIISAVITIIVGIISFIVLPLVGVLVGLIAAPIIVIPSTLILAFISILLVGVIRPITLITIAVVGGGFLIRRLIESGKLTDIKESLSKALSTLRTSTATGISSIMGAAEEGFEAIDWGSVVDMGKSIIEALIKSTPAILSLISRLIALIPGVI